jgi:hypothetical protein
MAEREGFEPSGRISEVVKGRKVGKKAKGPSPCLSPLEAGKTGEDVAKVVLAWANLSKSIRAAILALVEAGKGGQR